jgi:hypothetical protein
MKLDEILLTPCRAWITVFFMNTSSTKPRVSLDWSKLLGYSQVKSLQGTKNSTAKQAKIGAKIGLKAGVKIGAK